MTAQLAWIKQTLDTLPMPASPADVPWELSLSALVRPRLGDAPRQVLALADRFGALRLGPDGIGIDSTRVAWSDVSEIRTRPLSDVAASTTAEGISAAIDRLVPMSRLIRGPVQRLTAALDDVVLSLWLVALKTGGAVPVPVEVVHRDRRKREQALVPSVLLGAVLALPPIAASVVATATAHGVRVVQLPRLGDAAHVDTISRLATGMTDRLNRLAPLAVRDSTG